MKFAFFSSWLELCSSGERGRTKEDWRKGKEEKRRERGEEVGGERESREERVGGVRDEGGRREE